MEINYEKKVITKLRVAKLQKKVSGTMSTNVRKKVLVGLKLKVQ